MSVTNPLSLSEVRRLASSAEAVLLRAGRDADLETPIGAFLRIDDGDPAYLLESVEGGERLGRYSFFGVGPRRMLTVADGSSRIQSRPVEETRWDASLPVETLDVGDPLEALRAFVPRRRVEPVAGMPRFIGGAVGALAYDAASVFEPTVPLPDADPVGARARLTRRMGRLEITPCPICPSVRYLTPAAERWTRTSSSAASSSSSSPSRSRLTSGSSTGPRT